ncbi:MAG: O-antigen translocase [Limisphaerales bacterium]
MPLSATSSDPLLPALTPVQARSGKSGRQHTYGEILKSSTLIGGASVLNIGLRMIRTKAMALILGPAGVGLLGLYGSIADLALTIAGMGINSSGVRQIAEAAGTGDTHRVARTVTTLRRVALLLGALGAVLLMALCYPVSWVSFGDYRHAGSVALLSLAVLFGAVSAGQMALVQGMRRIRDLALINVLGSLFGLLVGVPIVYVMGKGGVVPSLVGVAGAGIAVSWWYSRKTKVEPVSMNLRDVSAEISALLKLGFVLMASGLMGMGVAYLVRIIVFRKMGEDAAGFYQAAWTLGGLYVAFILQAMGADFFPRLTAVANDRSECNRLVNEQAEVSLLLAGPGVIGTLTFAPLVIQLFYSARFGPAVEILRWICLGMTLRVASWPLGFILLAKGARQPYFWSELASNVVAVSLTWVCVLGFGLAGTGIAFFGGYVFYLFLIYAIVRSVSGFRWSAANKRIGLIYAAMIAAVFIGWYFLPRVVVVVGGALAALGAGVYSLRTLCTLVPLERMPPAVKRLLKLLRLAPAEPQV